MAPRLPPDTSHLPLATSARGEGGGGGRAESDTSPSADAPRGGARACEGQRECKQAGGGGEPAACGFPLSPASTISPLPWHRSPVSDSSRLILTPPHTSHLTPLPSARTPHTSHLTPPTSHLTTSYLTTWHHISHRTAHSSQLNTSPISHLPPPPGSPFPSHSAGALSSECGVVRPVCPRPPLP